MTSIFTHSFFFFSSEDCKIGSLAKVNAQNSISNGLFSKSIIVNIILVVTFISIDAYSSDV